MAVWRQNPCVGSAARLSLKRTSEPPPMVDQVGLAGIEPGISPRAHRNASEVDGDRQDDGAR
jgi:hypothetical protein